MMTRRDYWIGIGLIVTVLFLYLIFPRYEYRGFGHGVALLRIDHWTGHTRVVVPDTDHPSKPVATVTASPFLSTIPSTALPPLPPIGAEVPDALSGAPAPHSQAEHDAAAARLRGGETSARQRGLPVIPLV